ncbi:MsnO8 family LLM class oxidoreductase [Paenibacillus campi]|uniref:MsnO8 family LLM class oxidoreductase n=1 Tax=Paenibacillus campi TaxID=3106031 RepID=UPI002AFEA779|nr:MsnO8 family LLM class oxidoreductase [Paenibacillus sp. SGZ-1014]
MNDQHTPIPLGILDMSPLLEQASPEEGLERSVQLAIAAERWGYERFWLSEHHDIDGLACTAPEVLIAHIGVRTSSIRLGAGAVLLPHYSAMKVAETFRMLSALYPDRIDLGIGRAPGGSAHAAIGLSGNYLAHVAEMPTRVRDLRSLLEDCYTVEGTAVLARPLAAYTPQLWLLGTNRKSATLAAEHGAGYVFGHFMSTSDGQAAIAQYREQFQPSRSQTDARVILAVKVITAATEQRAEQLYDGWKRSPAGLAAIGEEMPEPIVGGPHTLSARINKLLHEYDADELLLICPLDRYDDRMHTYEYVAKWLLSDDVSAAQ